MPAALFNSGPKGLPWRQWLAFLVLAGLALAMLPNGRLSGMAQVTAPGPRA